MKAPAAQPGPVRVLLDTPHWQVWGQPWPVPDATPRWAWGVAARTWPGLMLEGIEMGLAYFLTARGGRPWFTHLDMRTATVSRHGEDEVRLAWRPNRHGVALQWTLRVSPAGPLLWGLRAEVHGRHPVWLHRWTLLRVGPWRSPRRGILGRLAGAVPRFGQRTEAPTPAHPGALRLHPSPGPLAFYAHAWASWGHTRVYFDEPARPQARFALDRLLPPRHDPAAPRPRGANEFYADLLGVLADRAHRRGLLLGFAGQRHFFGGLTVRLHRLEPHAHLQAFGDRVRLEPGMHAETDWAVLWAFDLDAADGMEPYLHATAQVLGLPQPRAAVPTGWLSWYEYFRQVTAADVRANAAAADDLAAQGVDLRVIQVDDGYAATPGAWGPPLRADFGRDLGALAADIRARGRTPGIWQAPLIAPLRAARDQRRGWLWHRGRPSFAGWVWNTWTVGLDPSHPAVRQRAVSMAREAAQQGFAYLKLDFLYAGALPGRRHDPTRSRAAALHDLVQAMCAAFREAAGPEATVLLCGVPLGTALGLADTVRIGPDVDPRWHMAHPWPPARRHPDVPGLGNALRGVLMRAWMHRGWWLNDPDALLPTSPHLTPAEQEAWATVVALSGGAWFVSADLTRLSDAARARLQRIFPPLPPARLQVVDLWDAYPPRRLRVDLQTALGDWHLVAVVNWDDRPARQPMRLADYGLPAEAAYWVRRFWASDPPRRRDGADRWHATIPAHGVGVWAVHPAGPGPRYAGSDLHLSQGVEVAEWQPGARRVALRLRLPGPRRGRVWLSLPAAPQAARLDGRPLAAQAAAASGPYAFEVAFTDQAHLVVQW